MKKALLIAVLSFFIFVSPALALNITLSTDKTKVLMGENITLSGKITFDNGSATKFEYRAAIVAPKGIVICDSKNSTTSSDGTFKLQCKLPTAEQADALGIPAALTRAIIPYLGGVSVKDPTEKELVKKHTRAIIAFNSDKLNNQLDEIIQNLDNFVNHAQRFVPESEKIAEHATRFNVTDVSDKFVEIQEKINDLITNANTLAEQARQLKANATAGDIENFRESLKSLRDDLKDIRNNLKDVKDSIKVVNWDRLKEVKKNTEEIKQDIEKKREQIKELSKGKELKQEVGKIEEKIERKKIEGPKKEIPKSQPSVPRGDS